MKILVTGGAGFIGSYLARRLAANNEVHVVDSGIRGDFDRVGGNITLHKVDLTSMEQIKTLDKDFNVIMHLAAINGTDNFYNKHHQVFEVGIKSVMNLYDYFKFTGATIVVASSAEVYQSPAIIPTDETIPCIIPDVTNHRYSYAGSKLFSELLVMNYGIDYFEKAMIFRPHNIYGPNMGFKHVAPQLIVKVLKAVDAGKDYIEIIGDGSETRAFCYVDDVVDGLEIMLEKGKDKNIYHIGNDDEVSIRHLIDLICEKVGVQMEVRSGDNTHVGGTKRRCPDITKMRNLGYEPKVQLEEGIERTVAWYKKNYKLSDATSML
jgi:UDP-glucose 4-epimerase